jgi:hypothetical protein
MKRTKTLTKEKIMCYSRCPFEGSHSGECSNPTRNSKSLNSHCFSGFVCKHCNDICLEEMQSDTEEVCQDCEGEYLMENCDSDIEYAQLLNKYKPLKISVDSTK